MKEYPKVPRYDHPTVDDSLFNSMDLCVLEKTDGSNFRFQLYEERFRDEYDIELEGLEDGDVVVGTKKKVWGTLSDDFTSKEGALRRAVEKLRQDLETDAIRSLHDDYGPIVFFAENMIPHTIDYNYDENPPPALIGFDIYAVMEDSEPVPNPDPFEERFTGFLSIDKAWDAFESVGIEPAPILERFDGDFDPEEFDVPLSKFGPTRAEGVVIRSDSQDRRVKKVTEEFREMNKERWGLREDEAENGAEWVTAAFATNGRIRKHLRKLVVEEGRECDETLVKPLTTVVIADIWKEEWHEISELSIPLCPSNIYPYVSSRVKSVITQTRQTADVSGVSIENVWNSDEKRDKESVLVEPAEELSTFEDDDVEMWLIDELIGDDYMRDELEDMFDEREAGGWVVTPLTEELTSKFWSENHPTLRELDKEIVPDKIKFKIRERIIELIEEEYDVEIGGHTEWEPNMDDEDFDTFGNLF